MQISSNLYHDWALLLIDKDDQSSPEPGQLPGLIISIQHDWSYHQSSPESGEFFLLLNRESVELLSVVHHQMIPPDQQDGCEYDSGESDSDGDHHLHGHQQMIPPEHQHGPRDDNCGGGDDCGVDWLPIHMQYEDNVILLSTKGKQFQHSNPTLSWPVRAMEHLLKKLF